MIQLAPTIQRIRALLAEDNDASVTYAALEARLALEKVVYDRLRQRHDYISHEQLAKWQPGAVINQLISDVDADVTQTRTLRMAKQPAQGVKPDENDFVEIGTEVGFDAKALAKMWNALAKLALHVRLPKKSSDQIPDYGDRKKIRAKIDEVLVELERLSKGTMAFSGLGKTVTFECLCGAVNKRRAALLNNGQRVFCINPDCKASWKVKKLNDEFVFEAETYDVECQGCGQLIQLPWRVFFEMKFDQRATIVCQTCNHENFVVWRLAQVAPREPEAVG